MSQSPLDQFEAAWKSFLQNDFTESQKYLEELINTFISSQSAKNKKQYSASELLKEPLPDKEFERAYFLSGVNFEKMGMQKKAEERFNSLSSNQLSKHWRLLGEMFSGDSSPDPALYNADTALAFYDRSLLVDSRNLETLHQKGLLLEKIGRHEEAKSCYRNLSLKELIGFNVIFPIVAFLAGVCLIVVAANYDQSWVQWAAGLPGLIIAYTAFSMIRGKGKESIRVLFKRL